MTFARTFSKAVFPFVAPIALGSLVASCTNAAMGPQAAVPSAPQLRMATAATQLLYVADHFGKKVNVYGVDTGRPKFIANFKVNGSPAGVARGPRNRIYVAIQNLEGASVVIFSGGSSTPWKSIQLGTDKTGAAIQPTLISTAPDGTFYVSRFHGSNGHMIGDVAQYSPDSPKPIRTIILPTNIPGGQTDSPLALGTALDESGNLLIAWVENDSNTGHILRVPPGASKGTDLGVDIGFPGSIVFDRRHNLIVVQQCCPPDTQLSVIKAGTTAATSLHDFGESDPFTAALTGNGTTLWIASAYSPQALFKFSYPSGKLLGTTQLPYIPWGIALAPGPFKG